MILDSLDKAIEARQAYTEQLDAIRALEAEVAWLESIEYEKQRYELKSIGQGTLAFVLKPDTRGTETPHWLCPNCFAKGKKSFLQNQQIGWNVTIFGDLRQLSDDGCDIQKCDWLGRRLAIGNGRWSKASASHHLNCDRTA